MPNFGRLQEELMSTHQRPEAVHRRPQQSPSMSELLASCAAADAVSTPPEESAADARHPEDDASDPGGHGPERRAA